MHWSRLLFGRPLRTSEEQGERIGTLRGVPVLGLDALASAAYGPEAALTVALPLGLAATRLIEPIVAAIIVVLALVALSYQQTIAAYPDGGGSYTVASQNLGRMAGLVAASALALDYILNVAVAIAAGVGAIVSAAPTLLPLTLWLCLAILAGLTIVNLRGVREAGLVFMAPTYLFVLCLGGAILLGVVKSIAAHGHPLPMSPLPRPRPIAGTALGAWLLLRAFASGTTAMTGIEAVSNGVPLFKEPRTVRAQRTLVTIAAILILLLAGIAFLSRSYGIAATPPGRAGYESVLSQLVRAVAGRHAFYYVTIASVVTVLCLSANTSFADFPRLCRLLALDQYLPSGFAHRGRRLVFSAGIIVLALLAGALLVVFGGVTDRLIPLFAIGALLAFTMSQWGMVAHWRRRRGAHARRSMLLNGAGAVATSATVLVVAASKFTEGAWITVLVIPLFIALLLRIHTAHVRVDRELAAAGPFDIAPLPPLVVVLPIKRLDRVARKALRLAMRISPEVEVIHVLTDEPRMEDLRRRWTELVASPVRAAGYPPPTLVSVPSAYREFVRPVVRHIRSLCRVHPDRYVAVVIPDVVERRWYDYPIRNLRALMLRTALLLRGGPHVLIVDTPWHLRGGPRSEQEQPLGTTPRPTARHATAHAAAGSTPPRGEWAARGADESRTESRVDGSGAA